MSSKKKQSAPRLQNIPVRTELGREIRSALDVTVCPAELDYAQIERRISGQKTCEVHPNGPDTECGKPATDETQGFPMCGDCVAAYKLEGLYEPADVLDRALAVWLKHLTEDELVELSERLDGEPGHPLLYKLDEYLAKVRPELFALEGVTRGEEHG